MRNYTGGSIPGTEEYERERKGLSTGKKNNKKNNKKTNNTTIDKRGNMSKGTGAFIGKAADAAAGIIGKIVEAKQQDYSGINKGAGSNAATTERTSAAWDTSGPTGSKKDQKIIWREGDTSY